MKRYSFCNNWQVTTGDGRKCAVTLPHDAQIIEQRSPSASNGGHGYFPGGTYVYEKTFTAPTAWSGKTVLVEFEGVYKNATVSLNGQQLAYHPYGYTGFTVPLTGLRCGGENALTVVADNAKVPNSRWYSGAGIYRPVWLWVGEQAHIAHQGVKITTRSLQPPTVQVETTVTTGEVEVAILDGDQIVAAGQGTECVLEVPEAKLWSAETPNLYTCRVTLRQAGAVVDQVEESFGIRQITWSNKGLFVNGKETLLRGGCIHHDNGILGAATYAKSEERRVRILKECGFNAVRSAHNPASPAFLAACDRYGLYVMDEAFDMWYVRKSKFDYGLDFKEWWQRDVASMVAQDFNHPSVILYSIGNEVSEPGKPEGVTVGKELIDYVHGLDASRPVTGGFNLMIMGNYAKGKGQYDNVDQEETAKGNQTDGKEPKNASLMFNMMAAMVGTGMNSAGNSAAVDRVTTPILDAVDIAGYNYASGRYPLEGKQHPNRLIFGSETFPQDIAKNWAMVQKYPYLVGDFMWTAWDYLGEAGIGAWSYTGGMPFNRPYPWVLAGAGVIDILGIPDASCRYAQTVWGQIDHPVIGVRPVNHPGVRVSKSVWRGTNAMESWSWQGCTGNKAQVEVYANAATVELLLNGKSLGKKKLKEYKAMFTTKYAPGTLTAVAYDVAGRETGRWSLTSATGNITISAQPEEPVVRSGDIVYIPVALMGENGVVESNADRALTVTVTGGELLAFGSANPCTEEQYHTGTFTTYYGRALAIVRAGEPGTLQVTIADGSKQSAAQVEIS